MLEAWASLEEIYKAFGGGPQNWQIRINNFWWSNSERQTPKPDLTSSLAKASSPAL